MLFFLFGADVLVPEWTPAGPQRLRCSFDGGEGCAEGHEAPSCAAGTHQSPAGGTVQIVV
jgi:hypothetical protein